MSAARSNRKKVLIITTAFVNQMSDLGLVRGGFVGDFGNALQKSGMEVHVATHGTGGNLAIDSDFVIHEFGMNQSFLRAISSGFPNAVSKPSFLLLVPLYFFKLFYFSLKCTINCGTRKMYIHWLFPTLLIARLIKLLITIEYTGICYGTELVHFETKNRNLSKKIFMWTLRGAKDIFAISNYTATRLEMVTGWQAHVQPDCIDNQKYSPSLNSHELKANEKFTYIFSGRMVERKGHKIVLEAFVALLKKHPNQIRLILGGDGPLKKELEDFAIKNSLVQDDVHFPGFMSHELLLKALNSAHVYVLPSTIDQKGDTEGSATAALEAMACEVPALISNIGGNQGSIWGKCGSEYFDPSNMTDLRNKMERYLNSRETNEFLGKAARQFVMENYDWNQAAGVYLGNRN